MFSQRARHTDAMMKRAEMMADSMNMAQIGDMSKFFHQRSTDEVS